eukprot:gnl/MRDRNA2_/MRDRNA2_107858_c0_seq1.p1 gnl/MRDRNA2_/MRDRNA2_107858_c0~~gnl/MRDRNA2_/MRDRNA2_107858_c0_seq1.p1  ORF type:complete len:513 (+),score=72.02 gnl/MRDRNA2_/MRDRNA2_107858_c0_seq1:100-1638(+)
MQHLSFNYLGASFLLTLCGPTQLLAMYDGKDRIESARLYGNVHRYAYWYIDLMVGTPPQRTSVIVDTGSSLCGFPCASCDHCGKHIDPLFDFAQSESAEWMKCNKHCDCKHGMCSYRQSYTEGSSINGFFFKDYVQLGDSISLNPPVIAEMGCHEDENKLFYTQKANGIMGLAAPKNSRWGTPTILSNLFRDHAHVKTNIFAMCLAEWGGQLTVGGYNRSFHTGNVSWIMLTSSSFYEVPLEQVTIDGSVVGKSKDFGGAAIVDSGTTYTYLPRQVYKKVRQHVQSYCKAHSDCGASMVQPTGDEGDCWRITDMYDGLNRFPTAAFSFRPGVKIEWPPRAYLYRKGQSSIFCSCFADNGNTDELVLGASWMLHKDVIFDLRNHRVGVASAVCPVHQARPGETFSMDDDDDAAWSSQPFFVISVVLLIVAGCRCSKSAVLGRRARSLFGRPASGVVVTTPADPLLEAGTTSSGSQFVYQNETGAQASGNRDGEAPTELEKLNVDGSSSASPFV